MRNYFSSNLKFLRLRNNDTQQSLTDKINSSVEKKEDKIHPSSIGKWENNDREPSVLNVLRVSEVYNIPMTDLVCRDLRITNSINDNNIEFELLKKVLIEKGYMKKSQDLTKEKFDELMGIANKLMDLTEKK